MVLSLASRKDVAAAALLGALIVSAHAAPVFRLTLMPDPPGERNCEVRSLNDDGQVVGTCPRGVAFTWTSAAGHQMIRDPRFPTAVMSASAINNVGTVLGTRHVRGASRQRTFIWDAASGFSYFGDPGRHLHFAGLNDVNVVVGSSAGDRNYVWKAFTWSEEHHFEYLRPSMNRRTLAEDINNAGQVVGSIEDLDVGITHAVRFEPDGSVTRMVPGHRESAALAVNALGHAAGSMQTLKNGDIHAFLWTPETGAIDIDPRSRDEASVSTDMNDAGQIVGKLYWLYADDGLFYWDAATGMVDLLTLLDPNDPLTAKIVGFHPGLGIRINNHGQITVNGRNQYNQRVPLLLTPAP